MNRSLDSKSALAAADLDDLMNKIRAEVADRKQLAGTAILAEPAPFSAEDFATRKWTARELLALPATDFARATHIAFLGREPSPDEFVRLRDRILVENVGRMRILREFRRSSEARAQKLVIEGLTRQFVWDRIYWSPPAKFGRAVGRGASHIWLLRRHIRKFVERVDALERRAAETTAALRNVQSAQMNDRQNTNRHVRRFQETIEADKKTVGARIEEARQSTNRVARDLVDAKARVSETQEKLVDHWRSIVEHKFELQHVLSALRAAAKSASPDSLASEVAQEAAHLLDPLYLSFEDRYRGSRTDIKERQRVYLGRVETAWALCDHAPVVDIGCGRGEWLELLSEAGIAGRGYDLNRIAIAECRERGFEAELSDGLEALAALSADSVSAVTVFHLIEHLPFESLVSLMDEALRVLCAGGVLILETPNPANLLVAAERFYMDPTHRNPLPSELVQYLLQSRGFRETEILPLHPVRMELGEQYSDPMLQLLQQKLYGPQDYGAIGRKSA
ncbi:MAG TPA: class I SAM-dependent methyltransferase [Rhizomicrobium sp.]|nr:class I SAM-dependent methyltransferase [Rhizomicrobium sp.]